MGCWGGGGLEKLNGCLVGMGVGGGVFRWGS